MKILCIEDIQEKFEHIKTTLNETNIDVIWKTNLEDGLFELRSMMYSYLLLDMSMPICKDSNAKDNFYAFAGMSILEEIKRKKYPIKVIIITGFDDFEHGNEIITLDELIGRIQNEYSEYYIGMLKYDSASVEWQDNLKKYLGWICK